MLQEVGHLRRLFAYNDWANREAFASLRAAGAPPARAISFMSHIVGAEWLWLSRPHQHRASVPVWPDLTLDECEAQVTELARRWRDYLSGLAPAYTDFIHGIRQGFVE